MIDAALRAVTGFITSAAEGMARDAGYPVPAFRLTVNGADIAHLIAPRLISLTLTDNRGIEADTLDIQLSDHDGLLAIPPKDAVVRLWLGWSDTGLLDKGTYTVDELEHSGTPDVLSIRARSADMRKGFKAKRERSWSNATLGEVLRAIASAYSLTPVIEQALGALRLLQVDQTGESDANLLTRLGDEHDAVATVKAGRLLFTPMIGGRTASGLALPHITLARADGDSHRYLQADRDAYTGARAYYYDVNSAKKLEAIAGGGDNLKELRHTYADQQSAIRAARAEWRRIQRGTATLSYNLAKARPELIPELTYTLEGIKQEIAATIWHSGNVQHSLTADGGFTTALELESQLPDELIDELAEREVGAYTGVVAWYRTKDGKQEKVTAGEPKRLKRLARLYANKKNAQKAAEREAKRLLDIRSA